MKIAVIGHKRVPSREGGIEKTVEKQMLLFRDRGHEVIFYNRSGHNIFGEQYDANDPETKEFFRGTRIETIYTPKNSLGVPVYSFLATRHALKERCDIIYYHGSGSCLMIPYAKRRGAHCVGMIHGIDSQQTKWGRFGRWYLRKGEKAAAKKADACLVLSEHIQKYMLETYGTEPVLTFNGTEPPAPDEKAWEALAKRFGIRKNGYVLTVVRIVAGKGLEYLIEAFKRCDTDKKLVIAGGVDPVCTEYAQMLRTLAKGDGRILFTGFLEEPDISTLYCSAYGFVFPSDHEGMAHSLLEAMAAGCCILASDIPENAAVLKNYGCTFRHGDTEDLKAKLQGLLNDPKAAANYRTEVADYALKTYNWEICVDRIEEIFDRCRS